MSIYAVTQALAAKARGLSGMRAAPDDVTDSVPAYPYALVYPWSGRWESNSASYKTGQHVWRVDIYIGRLPDVGARLKAHSGLIESLANALYLDPTLSGACESVRGIAWRWIEQSAGAIRELVLQFDVEVKYESANTA